MVAGRARGVLGTRGSRAHGHTRLAGELAGLVVAAVIVCLALDADTGDQRVTLQSHGADATCLVEVDAAFGAAAARLVSCCARVQAVFVDTRLVQRTVIVNAAFSCKKNNNSAEHATFVKKYFYGSKPSVRGEVGYRDTPAMKYK